MKLGWSVEVAGTGLGLPARVVTNDEFVQRLDTSEEWIIQRTGIRARHIVGPGESTLTLATAASRAALADADMSAEDIDLIICATFTPEHPLPSLSCELQAALGCRWVQAFDLAAACSGFVWGMSNAAQHIVSGMARNVLLVGVETLTTYTNMDDRATCILFGDGAGAAVLRPSTNEHSRILAARAGADGKRGLTIYIPAGGSRQKATLKSVEEGQHFIKMRGREVYKFAVTTMAEIMHDTARDAGHDLDEVALIVPHQSNLRIIESACRKAGVPMERVVINIDRYGNTSAASVGICLHESRNNGRIKSGDLVMLVAFGAGLTWGSILLRM
ncbi:MAG: beta-ketoacyl-ACP synthase III [Planctomycetota bacterium]